MADDQTDLFDTLMALKPADLTANAWAMRAGVNRNVFTDLKKRGRLRHDILDKLLRAADISWAQLDARHHVVQSEVAGTGMSARDVQDAWRGHAQQTAVPLVGSAIGGEWQNGDGSPIDEAIELTELHLHEVLDYLARPPSLVGDKAAYAVTIVGDSMAPRFEPGERAYVSPRAPASINDDVIVQLKGCNGDDGDRVTLVLIKRLVKRSATFVELRQFNPDTTFRVPATRIASIHRVVGRL